MKKLPKNEFLTYIPFSSKLFLALHAYPPFSPDKMRLTFNFYLFERQTPPPPHTYNLPAAGSSPDAYYSQDCAQDEVQFPELKQFSFHTQAAGVSVPEPSSAS